MAPAVVAASKALFPKFWETFRRMAERKVWECNAIAGERLWQMKPSPDPALRFTVHAVEQPADSVECSFDPHSGILTCKPGSAVKAGICRFRLTLGTASGPLLHPHSGRAKTRVCAAPSQGITPEQALSRILDELVLVERSVE